MRVALRSSGRRRRLLHLPLPLVRASLRALRLAVGPHVFATWEEAELLEEPMITSRGTADAEALAVRPLPMRAVLGAQDRFARRRVPRDAGYEAVLAAHEDDSHERAQRRDAGGRAA